MQGYGGFVTASSIGTEYFVGYKEEQILRLNAARYGIIEAFRDGQYRLLWVPVYMCKSVYEALDKERITYKQYHIDQRLEPEVENIRDGECILITNYYGLKGDSFYQKMCEKYRNIIFDNTQSFYSCPVLRKNVYNVYSPRKFFAVSDGAYVITEKFAYQHKHTRDFSGKRAAYLLRAVEEGTNAVYDLYGTCEEEITKSGVKEMSMLTHSILSNIPYNAIKTVREKNLLYVESRLENYNELNTDGINNRFPMVYPLLITDCMLRQELLKNCVYVSQWWKWVLENAPNKIEKKLSKYLLPIPIDQRYSITDMEIICNIVEMYCTDRKLT